MENYRQILEQQREALDRDTKQLSEEVEKLELQLEEAKERKSQAFKVLRGIEKKLTKQS